MSNGNPPAFPGLHPSDECRYQDSGMTLRDYFAGEALKGYISNTEWMNQLAKSCGKEVENIDTVNALRSYAAADAMLRARDK